MYWSQDLEDSDSSQMKILVLIEFLAAKSFWATAVSELIGTGVENLQLGRQRSSQLTSRPRLPLPPKPILCASGRALLAVPDPLTCFQTPTHLLMLFPLLRTLFLTPIFPASPNSSFGIQMVPPW